MRRMKRFTPTVLFIAIALAAGCRTPEKAAAAPTTHYVTPTRDQLDDRIAELERAGHTREGAERKARREFASQAWQTNHSQAWAAERVRAERSARREQMEKELSALEKIP